MTAFDWFLRTEIDEIEQCLDDERMANPENDFGFALITLLALADSTEAQRDERYPASNWNANA